MSGRSHDRQRATLTSASGHLRDRLRAVSRVRRQATAVIRNAEHTRVLLVRRSDNGWWTPVTGIVDPGEHPADTAVREAREEADVDIRVDRIASLGVTRMVTYANGDQAQYIDHTFACTYLGGNPRPADGENTVVRWFPVNDLPEMRPHMLARIDAGLSGEERARIATTTESR